MDNSELCGKNQEKPFFQGLFQSCTTGTCTVCNSLCAQISCNGCLELYLCFKCDEARHINYPFHNRISHAAGYRVPLASNKIIDENRNICYSRFRQIF